MLWLEIIIQTNWYAAGYAQWKSERGGSSDDFN